MEVVRGLHNLRPGPSGCAITIGNFDGVHLGHQAMLARLRGHGRRLRLPVAVLTFEPSPREYLDPANAPARLTRLREKLTLLAEQQIDRCIVLRFDARLQRLTAAEFMDLLQHRAGARLIVVGHDFRFAHRGEADAQVLLKAAPGRGFEVDVVEPVMSGSERISSTKVRAALAAGNLERARALLGRNYAMCGRVVEGDKLGRKLGFPTANIRLHRKVSPVRGIFAARVHGRGLDAHPAVVSIGTRPTLSDGLEWMLEVHLFDFDGELYGERLTVEFTAFLREELKFPDLDSMVAQMYRDAQKARSILL